MPFIITRINVGDGILDRFSDKSGPTVVEEAETVRY